MKLPRCDIYETCPQRERPECYSWRYKNCVNYEYLELELTEEVEKLRRALVNLDRIKDSPIEHLESPQQFEQIRRML